MVTNTLRRRAAATALALFCAGFLSTCDFLTSDIFPSWFSYVEARVDLRSIMKANGLGDLATVEALEFAPFVYSGTDYSKIMIFAVGEGTNRLFLLDPNSLKLKNVQPSNVDFSRSMAVTAGGFQCGKRMVNPLDFSNTPTYAWSNTESVRVFLDGGPVTGTNYSVEPSGDSKMTEIRAFDVDWTSIAGPLNRSYDTNVVEYNLLDADAVNGFSVLASPFSRSDMAFVSSFPFSSDFLNAGHPSFLDPGNIINTETGPFRCDDGRAWLTSVGPVAFVRGDRNSDRLIRYRWGTGGFSSTFGDYGAGFSTAEERDSLPIDNDDDLQVLSFEPSGRWWFAYDRRTGYLYKLRTWWR